MPINNLRYHHANSKRLLVWINDVAEEHKNIKQGESRLHGVIRHTLSTVKELLEASLETNHLTIKAMINRAVIEHLGDLNAIFNTPGVDPDTMAAKYFDNAIDFLNEMHRQIPDITTGDLSNTFLRRRIWKHQGYWNNKSIMGRIDKIDANKYGTRNWYDILCHFTHINLTRSELTPMLKGPQDHLIDAVINRDICRVINKTLQSDFYTKQEVVGFRSVHEVIDSSTEHEAPR